ncbi:hypothetical protein P154DRAFT_524201 [Amniculicola lignicola CBS 123094]|uniref:Uncharacterized protein n=1 Tax=Amniculicola lignicola CBS 123094 TaxID=1392246 RepID=A0A6A5W989_9PLEO|nr:hypothetical protein P154DRAFT_524201 [Amniculicola lignicola CBS 123094]
MTCLFFPREFSRLTWCQNTYQPRKDLHTQSVKPYPPLASSPRIKCLPRPSTAPHRTTPHRTVRSSVHPSISPPLQPPPPPSRESPTPRFPDALAAPMVQCARSLAPSSWLRCPKKFIPDAARACESVMHACLVSERHIVHVHVWTCVDMCRRHAMVSWVCG